MAKSEIIKDLVSTYKKYAEGLKTIIYCVNVEHSEEVARAFCEAGYKADYVHSKTSKEAFERFKNNDIDIITNVDILTTGIDLEDVYCLMIASPTKSFIKATQIYGRIRLNKKDKDKVGLILDCSKTIENTQHPYAKFDFNKEATKREAKLCSCGGSYEIVAKNIKDKNDLYYTLETIKRCKLCKNVEITEDIKVVNIEICDACGATIDTNIEMQQKKNSLEFVYKCGCGNTKTVREVILTQKELEEIKHEEIMQTETWERVKKMLLASCRRCGYNHRYSVRLIEYMQDKGLSVQEAINAINDLDSKGQKISRLMYGYFK